MTRVGAAFLAHSDQSGSNWQFWLTSLGFISVQLLFLSNYYAALYVNADDIKYDF